MFSSTEYEVIGGGGEGAFTPRPSPRNRRKTLCFFSLPKSTQEILQEELQELEHHLGNRPELQTHLEEYLAFMRGQSGYTAESRAMTTTTSLNRYLRGENPTLKREELAQLWQGTAHFKAFDTAMVKEQRNLFFKILGAGLLCTGLAVLCGFFAFIPGAVFFSVVGGLFLGIALYLGASLIEERTSPRSTHFTPEVVGNLFDALNMKQEPAETLGMK